jgi:hypothetical protein
MTRTCTVCRHPERESIEVALVSGTPLRDIAGHPSVSKSALDRHKEAHLSASVVAAKAEHDALRIGSLLEETESLLVKISELLRRAEESGDIRTAIAGVREARGCLDLLARLQPQLPRALTDEDWEEIRGILSEELRSWPDLRSSISNRLKALDVEDDGLEGR